MEGRPAGERHVPEPPDPHKRPEGLPEAPHVTEMKARINRDRAVTGFMNTLTELTELGIQLATELLQQAEEERVENAEHRARHGR